MRGTQRLIAYNLVLALLLLLPLLLHIFGGYSAKGRYLLVNQTERTYPYLYREIFEETGDLDIVFLSSSLIWAAIETPYVEKELSRALGHPARVRTLSWNWWGLDFQNLLLRDLLAHRRVKLLVTMGPGSYEKGQQTPHAWAASYLQWDQARYLMQALDGLSPWQYYALSVLGAPRQLIATLRPPERWLDPEVLTTNGAGMQQKGYFGTPFASRAPLRVSLSPDEAIYGRSTAAKFSFLNEKLPPFGEKMMKLFSDQVREHHVPVIFLNIPHDKEIRSKVVMELQDWPREFNIDGNIVGIPASEIFGGLTENATRDFFYDRHLNRNGAETFTRAITPTLVQIYLKKVGKNGTRSVGNDHRPNGGRS